MSFVLGLRRVRGFVLASGMVATFGACGEGAIGSSSGAGGTGPGSTGGSSASGGASGDLGLGGSSAGAGAAGAGAGTSGGGGAGAAGTTGQGGAAGAGGSSGGAGGAPLDAGNGGAAGRGGAPAVDASAGRGGAAGGDAAAGRGGAAGAPLFDGGTNPAESLRVSAWLTNTLAVGALPNYAYAAIRTNFGTPDLFNKLVTAIVNSCAAFAPTAFGIVDCEAMLVSAIVAESSYNPASTVFDAFSNGTDPTVGLLQIRFSSTVHDYNFYGHLDVMGSIGCPWPTNFPTSTAQSAWTNPGATGIAFMQDPACSVGLAAWYYFYNATCNGGASGNPVFIAQCCAGQGMAGNITIGLLSHLRGPDPANPPGPLDPYVQGIECCAGGNPALTPCNGCTGRFAAMIGGLPSPDPFTISLVPEPVKYCR